MSIRMKLGSVITHYLLGKTFLTIKMRIQLKLRMGSVSKEQLPKKEQKTGGP